MHVHRSGSPNRRDNSNASGASLQHMTEATALPPGHGLGSGRSLQMGLEDLGSLPDADYLPSTSAPTSSAFATAPLGNELDDLFGPNNPLLHDLNMDRAPSWCPSQELLPTPASHTGLGQAPPPLHPMPAVQQPPSTYQQQPAENSQPHTLQPGQQQNLWQPHAAGHTPQDWARQQPAYSNVQATQPFHTMGYPLEYQLPQAQHNALSSAGWRGAPMPMPANQQRQHQQYTHPYGLPPHAPYSTTSMPIAPPQSAPGQSAHQQAQAWMPVENQKNLPHGASQPLAHGMHMGVPVKQEGNTVADAGSHNDEADSGPDEGMSAVKSDPDTDETEQPVVPGRRRTRNEQQKMSNRVAQRRYRQRGKDKANDLETTVAALTDQLASMEPMAQRKKFLQGRNAELQAQLQQQQGQLDSVRVERNATAAFVSPTGSDRSSIESWADTDLQTPASPPKKTPQHQGQGQSSESAQATLHAMAEKVASLQSITARLKQEPAGATPDPYTQAEPLLKHLIAEFVSLSAQARVEAGITPATSDQQSRSGGGQSAQSAVLQRVAAELYLSDGQKQELARAREQCDRGLQQITQKQSELSAHVANALPAESPRDTAEAGSAPFGSPRAIAVAPTFLKQAKHLAHMRDSLTGLKTQMRSAQDARARFDVQVTQSILTPLQATHVILSLYPTSVDILAVCNAAVDHPYGQ